MPQADENSWHRSQMVNPKVQHFKKNNAPFFVNIHASPARYLNREALIVGTTDITEMIEKDTQLIQASKMTTLGEMSAGIAHELNQPLNAIKIGNEFFMMMIESGRAIPDKDLFDVAHEVSSQVDRAADIINRLRDFGRKADFTKEKISINTPIRGVLEIVGKQLALQNIEVDLDLDESIPPILAHHNRLEQVIFNLVTNARDAINYRQDTGAKTEERRIKIRSRSEANRVIVSVSDTGIGIPEAVRSRIFEAFFTTKQMGEGMGLGLSITSGIVGDYGGEIEIDSSEGHGTTFTLSFPRAGR
jgi:C4-dicarboxylate-specific signal transduction histidine kinase